MVATDFLGQDDARRVLALRADSAESVSYSVMRTGRGDLIDSSPAQRVEVVSGRSDGSSRTIAQDCAQCRFRCHQRAWQVGFRRHLRYQAERRQSAARGLEPAQFEHWSLRRDAECRQSG